MKSATDVRQPDTSLDRWLARKGLRANPFQRWNAEHDQDLPNYFVDIGGFDELLHLAEPCVIFAPRGCGKTAQRQMLASQCRPYKRDSPWLAMAYTYSGFERALDSADSEIRRMRPIHYVSALCHLGLIALVDEASRDSRIHNALADPGVAPRLTAYVTRFAPHLAGASTTGLACALDGLGSLELLQGFSRLVKDAGVESCVVLVDGVDETDELKKELVMHVRKEIGPIATPEAIQFAPALPKTRSGKIMRRILRKIAENATDNLGDITTLADPSVVEALIKGRG